MDPGQGPPGSGAPQPAPGSAAASSSAASSSSAPAASPSTAPPPPDRGPSAVSPEEERAYAAAQEEAADEPVSKKTRTNTGIVSPSDRPTRVRRSPAQAGQDRAAEAAAAYAASPAGIAAAKNLAQKDAAISLAELSVDKRPRDVGEKAVRSSEEESLIKSFMEYTPTTLVERVWGAEQLAKWRDDNKVETGESIRNRAANPKSTPKFRVPPARDLLELLNPAQKQCQAIIEKMGDKPCYICGFAMGPLAEKNGLSPECEHILSVAQAILLYDLYQVGDLKPIDSLGEPRDPAKQRAFFAEEYRWAHNVCNQVKSDDNIIAYTEGKGFGLDFKQLRTLLTAIYNEKRAGGPQIKAFVDAAGGLDLWIDRRISAVLIDIQPLLFYLNVQLFGGGDRMFALGAAARILTRVHYDFRKVPPTINNPLSQEKFREHAAMYGEDFVPAYDAASPAAPGPEPGLAGQKRRREGGKRRKTYRMRRCRLPKLL